MIEINLNNVSKNYGTNIVLKNINFEIKSGEKVALIGQNGSGKTTIFKLINKEEKETSGEINIRKNSKISMLSQYPDESVYDKNVKEIIYSSFKEINMLKDRLEKEELNMQNLTGKQLEKSIMNYSKIQEEFINLGGYEIDTKIDKIISAFKAKKIINSKFGDLSGGEKTIINIICIFLENPDIILLDEPTNHLDIDMIELLEKYLINSNKTIIIISHDRYFLDKVVKKVILVENGKTEIFHGNYSYYLKENEERIMRQFNNYKNQQTQIEAMKKSIKKLREFGRLAYPCGEGFYRRAASIEKRLEKIEPLEKPKKEIEINLNFEFDNRSGKNVLDFDNYNLTIGENELLKNARLSIKYKEKICIMGKNGSGKTTLIKEIMKNNENIKKGSNVKIGYIPQEILFENEDEYLIDEARKFFIGEEEKLRSALVKFMFYSEKIYTKLNKLSGGERIILKLFCLMQENNNLLIFDEPTNHIDINTREILENALKKYDGTIIIVSHDRYFINKLATSIVMINNKKTFKYVGNYDDYKETMKRLEKSKE